MQTHPHRLHMCGQISLSSSPKSEPLQLAEVKLLHTPSSAGHGVDVDVDVDVDVVLDVVVVLDVDVDVDVDVVQVSHNTGQSRLYTSPKSSQTL